MIKTVLPELIALLLNGTTAKRLQKATGVSESTAHRWIKHLDREDVIEIKRYTTSASGYPAAVWGIVLPGEERCDAERPAPKTRWEREQAQRIRQLTRLTARRVN